MDEELIEEFVELAGSAAQLEVPDRDLRAAITSHPELDASRLVRRLQLFIPELLRRGIWLQRSGLPSVRIINTQEFFEKRSLGIHHMTDDLRSAVYFYHGRRFR